MQVSVEATGKLERTMKVRVPAEQIEKEVSQRLARVAKTAKLKGFRPGKIPPKVVEKRYGGQVRQEVLSDVLQRSYQQALQQEALMPAGGPRIQPDEAGEGGDFSYTAVFEVFPEVELSQVEGLTVERPQVEITDEDVDSMLERLRLQHSSWEGTERAAAKGDLVRVDFEGRIDGEPFEGGTAQDIPVVLGEGSMLDDFEQGLYGMSAGESRSIDVRFPDDYRNTDLAGKQAVLDVTVKAVEERVLPEVDAAFAERFGIEDGSVETLLEEVRENMQHELDERIRNQIKRQVLEALAKANPLEVPGSLVDQEVQTLQQESMRRLGVEDPAKAPSADALRPAAERRVAVGLLINELIRQHDIKVDPQRVSAHLENVAAGYEKPDEIIRLYQSEQRMRNQIDMIVLEEQVAEWLVERAEVTDKPVPFSEYMQDQ